MHAVFMPYGKKECVDVLIRDMTSQKLNMRFCKEGEPDMNLLVECQLRMLPFGIMEFIFPKEFADVVLTTLRFNQQTPYNLDKEIGIFSFKLSPLKVIRDFLRVEPPPNFKTDQALPWLMNDVAILPIGVRYDADITNPDRQGVLFPGWRHEGI